MLSARSTVGPAAWQILSTVLQHRHVLQATTRLELAKRYSGSLLGKVWIVLQPALLLAIYLFVYLVVFKMRFDGFSSFDYVLYVFCGLIPFLGFSEAITTGCPVLKQNLHLVKNVMLPIELIPIRGVLLGMTSQMVSLGVLLVMLAGHGDLGPGVVVLPVVVLLQVLFLAGAVLVLSTLTLLLPDVGYFVNLGVMLLMFVSPIGFKPEMIPTAWQWVLYINPIHYLTEAYRACLLADHAPSGPALSVYVVMCVGAFALGCEFFRRFRDVLVDFE